LNSRSQYKPGAIIQSESPHIVFDYLEGKFLFVGHIWHPLKQNLTQRDLEFPALRLAESLSLSTDFYPSAKKYVFRGQGQSY
jgi:hypothetical protein